MLNELKTRCHKLLKSRGYTIPINYGPGVLYRVVVENLLISFDQQTGLRVEITSPNGGGLDSIMVFLQRHDGPYVHEEYLKDRVMPILRAAMILDDLADVGGASGDGSISDSES